MENKLADEGQAEIGFAAYNVVFFTHMICLVGVICLFYIWFSKLWKCFSYHFGCTSMSPAASGSSSHSNLEKIKYEVFISFRGEDTRSNFTSHLHHALCQAKIKAFMDEDDLEKGHEISPTLKKAIEESKLCLVILSKHYASSRWCLDELENILKCKKLGGQAEVLPVFYKIDPSDVRKQQKSYAVAFSKLGKRFDDKKLQKWRDALTKIANLSGWASNDYRSESQLIVTIVDDVIKKLNDMSVPSDKLQGLVGIVERIKDIEKLLQIGSLNVGPIGIWGTGGIGKTTLAEAVCKQLSFHFETCVFLKNVREELEKHGPTHLKDKFFSELLEGENRVRFAWDRLHLKRLLAVLDDVDDVEQIEQLITGNWFGPESRIIITSRDQQVLRNIGVSETYEVKGLNDDEALELFSLHAFKKNSPTASKKELSKRAVHYAGGIPLALKVLGCLLFSKTIEVWKSNLDMLEQFPNKKIARVLRISYDALEDTEKDIFLDIACVLKGMNRGFVEQILNHCGLYARAGIDVLIDKALITIGHFNTVEMHSLLQMMAFQIFRPQSSNQDPRKGTRLMDAEDIYQALKNDRGLENIEGISLDTSNCNRGISLLPTTFSKMCGLRLLKIDGSKLCLPQGPPAFPEALRYLYWSSYPLKSLSTYFIAEKLVELNMRGSQLEKLWEGAPNLVNLKYIDLSESMHLTQLPDLSRALNIERVILWYCAHLTEVPSYFQHLTELKELSLIGCPSLCKLSGLPKSLTRLEVLNGPFERYTPNCRSSRKCYSWFPSRKFSSKLERFPKISKHMEFLSYLTLEFAAIKELPFSIENLTGLKILSLRFCKNLEILPNNIHNLSSLQELNIDFCQKLEALPVLPSPLSILDARGCTSLKMMSSSIPLVKQNWDDFYNRSYLYEDFMFWGCGMLDENARRVLMDEALFRILRFATLISKYGSDGSEFYLDFYRSYYPGSEIPRWFSHESDESSICIKLPHPDCWYNSSYLGLAFCIILEFNNFLLYPYELSGHCESVYMFPNGDSWKQRRNLFFFISHRYHHGYGGKCCRFTYDEYTAHNVDVILNSEYVHVFMDNTYGEFLTSNNGQIDSFGNKFPRTATVDFHRSGEFGEYIKAEEGRFDDANGNTVFTTPTATASFSFNLSEEIQKYAKIKKCGVHLLYTQEADRFGFVERIDKSKSSGDESIHSKSGQEDDEEDDDGGESHSSRGETIHSESDDQEED